MPTLHPDAQVVLESPYKDSGANLPKWGRKVRVAFRLTQMGVSAERVWFWLWSSRGKFWVIEQDFRSAVNQGRSFILNPPHPDPYNRPIVRTS
jgi:hypothetical protein